MFSFHTLPKTRDPHWSAEVKQESTQEPACIAAILFPHMEEETNHWKILSEA